MKVDLARELYKSWRDNSRKNRLGETLEPTRNAIEDPQALGSVLSELVTNRDWRQGIAEGSLFTDWISVVGQDIGAHSTPISLVDGLLTVQATSSAWATQLTLMNSDLLRTISNSAPGALVERVLILPPGAPSWKKGIRTIRNARGPRDTYG
ncbi:MAG TPA: DciA family protein [Candidatus Nanopelagicaceae bacterium]